MAAHYKFIDLDLLMTGAILHDIGKVAELTYDRSFGYSSEGQLLGHIIIGLRFLHDKLQRFPDFPPKLRTLVEHMILSHHGELEYGSPKVPLFPGGVAAASSGQSRFQDGMHAFADCEGPACGWLLDFL